MYKVGGKMENFSKVFETSEPNGNSEVEIKTTSDVKYSFNGLKRRLDAMQKLLVNSEIGY
jgi:hypothetical protein